MKGITDIQIERRPPTTVRSAFCPKCHRGGLSPHQILCGSCGSLTMPSDQILPGVRRKPGKKKKGRRYAGAKLRELVYTRDGFKCVGCGDGVDLTLDHIKPVSKGGKTEPDNLQTMCRPCNQAKGSKYTPKR